MEQTWEWNGEIEPRVFQGSPIDWADFPILDYTYIYLLLTIFY